MTSERKGETGADLRWKDIPSREFAFDPAYLSLPATFSCGQVFRWQPLGDGGWAGVVGSQVWRLRYEGTHFSGQAFPPPLDLAAVEDYLRLEVDLAAVYADLRPRDEHIAAAIRRFPGLRLLAQEPMECLLSFVCSTGNAIPRIAGSIEKMAMVYGEPIARIAGVTYHAFPTARALADADQRVLAEDCALDYRGARLQDVAATLLERPANWLRRLRERPYEEAHRELLTIRGVGLKIADCVALFALYKDEAVPVDTHIWQLGREIFLPEMSGKSITPVRYTQIASLFRARYGRYAGWAQEYLYYGHLGVKQKRRKE